MILVDLRAEWNACSSAHGHEPTYEQWYVWCLKLLRSELAPQGNKKS